MINNYNPVTNGGGTLPPPLDVILGSRTEEGEIVSFDSWVGDFPIKGLKVNIKPLQSGTGDPSPNNIRPITGWTECNIYRSGEDTSNPTVIPITFPSEAGTVYGGTLEINEDGSGTLTVTHGYLNLREIGVRSGMAYREGYPGCYTNNIANLMNRSSGLKCSAIKTKYVYNVSDTGIYVNQGVSLAIRMSEDYLGGATGGSAGFAALKDYIENNDIYVSYELATPIVVNFTIDQITTLLGTNNIWADTGDIEVTYGDYLNIINSRLSALESNS